MSALFTPLRLRELELVNRIVVSPMCQYSALDGKANNWHFAHLASMSLSGAAMVIVEATAVEPEGRITPGCLGLWNDATEEALKPALEFIRHNSSTAVAMQLAHAGRKASSHVPWEGGQMIPVSEGGWVPFAPSTTEYKHGETVPAALDDAGLSRVRNAFAETTRRAVRLGFDALEIHSAHGYLLHEFLSPLSNKRTDDYGGPLENRMRFPLEIFEIVRENLPAEKPLGVKNIRYRLGGRRVGYRAIHRLWPRIEEAWRRLDCGILWRPVAAAKDYARAGLSSTVRAPHQKRNRRYDDGRWPNHRAEARGLDPRERRGRLDRPGEGHALRPPLGMACSSRAGSHRDRATAILASAAPRVQRPLQRIEIRSAVNVLQRGLALAA